MLVAALAISLGGCDDFPNDIAGTMDSVRASGVMRTGLVASKGGEADERALANGIAEEAGVDVRFVEGSAEILLQRLEAGELDLVVGPFAKSSPWAGRVALTKPATAVAPPKDEIVLRAAVRPGENRWLIFVSRAMKEEPA